jgi:hypothetical protein
VFIRQDVIGAHLGALLIRAIADAHGTTDLDAVKIPRDLAAQARICRDMGLSLAYHPEARTLTANGAAGEIVISLR